MKNSNIIINDLGINNTVCIHDSIKLANKATIEITIKGNNNKITILEECNFKNTTIFIEGSKNSILINKYVTFQGNIIVQFDKNSIDIGKLSSFGLVNLYCSEGCKISIGKNCMFSRNILLRTNDGHSIINNETKEKINIAKDIYIGNYVWCGMNSNILKGAYISSMTVIGAFSTVTKKFPKKYIVIAGKPAKIVKEEIIWIKQSLANNITFNKNQISEIQKKCKRNKPWKSVLMRIIYGK